jgi:predicted permease
MPTLDGGYLVIGVTPPDFHPLHMSNPAEVPRVFMPLGFDPDRSSCRSAACRGFRAIARLKHGVTAAGAHAELDILVREWVHTYPAELAADESLTITPLRDHVVGRFGSALWMLECAALLLLVLACANSATLLLARTMARQPELALRVALGADRFRVVRTLLTESLIIAGVAGVASAAGTALAWGATHLIARTGDANLPRIAEVAPDRATLLLAIAVTAITVVAFGLAPVLIASRGLFVGLRVGHGVAPGPTHAKALRAVIAMEVGAAFVLVAVVALLSKSYLQLTRVNPGYDPENLLTVSLLPAGIDQQLAYFDAVAAETRRIPGVHDAAYASTLPLSHPATGSLYIREHLTATDADAAVVDIYLVSQNYLDVMRIPVVRGRTFTPQDTEATQRVAVISESTARAQFPGEDPIGQHIKVMSRADSIRWAVVVGTVRDVHQYALDDSPDAAVYVLFAQYTMQGYASLVVRSTVPPDTLARPLGEAILAVDPTQPVFHLQPMSRYIELSLSQQTFVLRLIAAFGVLALTLAIAGVHGVVSHVVHQRGREIGLRLALGATATSVQWLILRHVLTTAAVGIAVGFIALFTCRDVLSSLLFNVSPVDVDTTATVAVLLIVGAFVAGYTPVARAARVDPAVVLRAE